MKGEVPSTRNSLKTLDSDKYESEWDLKLSLIFNVWTEKENKWSLLLSLVCHLYTHDKNVWKIRFSKTIMEQHRKKALHETKTIERRIGEGNVWKVNAFFHVKIILFSYAQLSYQ